MGIQKVKTVIVGCGMISDVYLYNTINRFSILEVVGCCDIIPQAAAEKAEKYKIRAMTLDEILIDNDVELVINLTAPAFHYEVTKALLQGGKHVYTEKVLASGLEQARELVAFADEKSLYLGAAPDTFLGSAVQTARFALDSGMIGEPTGCVAVLGRDNRVGAEFIPYIAREGGGIGFDVGIYYMTALSYLLGPAQDVTGFMATRNPARKHYFPWSESFGEEYCVQCENIFVGSVKFANGAYGSLQFNSECIMNDRPELTVYGTQGILYLPDPDGFGGDVKVLRRANAEPVIIQQNHGYGENSRGVGAAELAWALRRGRTPRASKEMALHSLEVLCGVAISSETKSTYSIKSTFERTSPLPQGHLEKSGFADYAADQEAALAE